MMRRHHVLFIASSVQRFSFDFKQHDGLDTSQVLASFFPCWVELWIAGDAEELIVFSPFGRKTHMLNPLYDISMFLQDHLGEGPEVFQWRI